MLKILLDSRPYGVYNVDSIRSNPKGFGNRANTESYGALGGKNHPMRGRNPKKISGHSFAELSRPNVDGFLFAPDDYHIRRFQMEQNDKTKEGQQENERDVQKILDEELERTRQWGKENGIEVRINEDKSPVVIFNPPRHLVEQAKRSQARREKEQEEQKREREEK